VNERGQATATHDKTAKNADQKEDNAENTKHNKFQLWRLGFNSTMDT
jgi:hypothetical protein